MRNWLPFIAVIALCVTTGLSEGERTPRKEWKPDVVEKLHHVTIEDKIIKQAIQVEEYRKKCDSFPADSKETEGFLWWKSNAKENAQRRLMKAGEYLTRLLASTPSDANEPKDVLIEKEGGKGKEADIEILEIQFAQRNLDNIRILLTKDPNDWQSLAKCFACHVTCMAAIIGMCEELVANIDSQYIPAIQEQQKSTVERLAWANKRLRQHFETEANRALVQRSKAEDEERLMMLEVALGERLPAMKRRAEAILPALREKLQMARYKLGQVEDWMQVEGLIKDFRNNLERLASPTPLTEGVRE